MTPGTKACPHIAAPPPPAAAAVREDRAALAERASAMDSAGGRRVTPNNPYWSRHGVTYVDPDGYHVVLAVPHGL